MTFLFDLLTRRFGVGFTIRVRSTWLTVDALSIHAGASNRWEASWCPEDGALWETAKASGGWLTRIYERGRGWTIVEEARLVARPEAA